MSHNLHLKLNMFVEFLDFKAMARNTISCLFVYFNRYL